MNGLLDDSELPAILRELQLTAKQVMERNENFLLLKCAGRGNKSFVIKYSHSPKLTDGIARINKETALVKHLKADKPLRFLKYHAHGENFLVTEFEEGETLSPDLDYEEALRKSIADALIKFQMLGIAPAAIGVKRESGLGMFYIKGLMKHLIHLWPDHISLSESCRCLWIIVSSLPALGKTRAVCHGDLLPSNLIYKAAEREIVFTDLESFLSENHPLYDVLCFCTVDDTPIWKWRWQKRFIQYYLERARDIFHFDVNTVDFGKVTRALLVFLSVYRLNETRINLEGTAYFDGLAKRQFVLRKATRLLKAVIFNDPAGALHEKLETRVQNLKTVLSKELCTKHVSWLLDGRGMDRQESV
jgi:thiamine kinase-like enzyme